MRAVIVVCAVLLMSGCTGSDGGTREITFEKAGDPWKGAGVTAPVITSRTEVGKAVVQVQAETRLPIEDGANPGGFARRVANIMWRTHQARLDVLDVIVAGRGHPAHPVRRYDRQEMTTIFGPRPAGLDDGMPAPALTPGPGRFFGSKAGTLDQAASILRDLLVATATGYYHHPPGRVKDGIEEGKRQDCLVFGFSGEQPSGRYNQGASLKVVTQSGYGQASLPGLAEYWAGLGLEIDIVTFNDGTGWLRARIPGVGLISAITYAEDDYPDSAANVRLGVSTVCLKP